MTEAEEFEFRARAEKEAKASAPAPSPSLGDSIIQGAKNLGLGAVRGAGSIGSTLLWPVDAITDVVKGDRGPTLSGLVTGNQPLSRHQERVRDMNEATASLGADPNSLLYKTGKLGAEIAGTAGTGAALGLGARAAGAAPEVVSALASNGFTLGAGSQLTPAAALALRSAAGAATGGAQVGLVSPDTAGTGAAIGAALPGALKVVGAAGSSLGSAAQSGAQRLMQSALKPTQQQLRTGEAAAAVRTLLDEGINPTVKGVETLKTRIGDLNDQIGTAISNSDAVIDPNKVVAALKRSTDKFGNQVSPTADLKAIDSIKQDFLANAGAGELPVQLAQKLKQGTYSVLKGKYGEMGSATTEAQKDLARGLKEGVADAVPAVVPLNARESALLNALKLADRRALMDANKNPLSLDTGLALATGHPLAAASLMANSTAATKASFARALNALSGGTPEGLNALAGPMVYRAIPSTARR